MLWLVSEACRASMRSSMVFKCLLNKQIFGCNSSHNWLMNLAMDRATLCDMWEINWFNNYNAIFVHFDYLTAAFKALMIIDYHH